MQSAFDDRIHGHFIDAQFTRDTGEIEGIKVGDADFKPGRFLTRPRSIGSGNAGTPLVLKVRSEVGSEVKAITDILDGVVLDKPLKYNELRYTVDDSADSLGKKIKRATELKIPVLLIVGPKDAEEGIVSIRLRDSEDKVELTSLATYLKKLK